MKYRVTIFNEKEEIISNDIWYGISIDNLKFWVDLALLDIAKKTTHTNLHYAISEELRE